MVSKQHSLEQVTERTVELLRAHRSSLIYGLRVVIGVLLIAACLEIFVFNFNYFRSAGYESLNLEDRLDLIQTDDEEHYRITAQHNTIEFHDLNKSLEDIYIDFDNRQPAQPYLFEFISLMTLMRHIFILLSTLKAFPKQMLLLII